MPRVVDSSPAHIICVLTLCATIFSEEALGDPLVRTCFIGNCKREMKLTAMKTHFHSIPYPLLSYFLNVET